MGEVPVGGGGRWRIRGASVWVWSKVLRATPEKFDEVLGTAPVEIPFGEDEVGAPAFFE